ncbi:hypothetical protein AKJ09_05298 [Labilithrix luteola]|uniref:Uncharacterized protein n=1 Tax=Labilithrix luteola TaxID=1391654 RepID=A0A0K1PZQ5_9BACT|nr:hypothetical protein AKJ09_05298 [Labilithrix luteola]
MPGGGRKVARLAERRAFDIVSAPASRSSRRHMSLGPSR